MSDKLVVSIQYNGAVGWSDPASEKLLLVGFGFVTQDKTPATFKVVHKGDRVKASIKQWSPRDNRDVKIFYAVLELV